MGEVIDTAEKKEETGKNGSAKNRDVWSIYEAALADFEHT